MPAATADEVFSVNSIINVPNIPPNTGGLASFDVEFVDPAAGVLLLADRSNKSIDVINTSDNSIFKQLQPGFVGPLASGSPGCPPMWRPYREPTAAGPMGC